MSEPSKKKQKVEDSLDSNQFPLPNSKLLAFAHDFTEKFIAFTTMQEAKEAQEAQDEQAQEAQEAQDATLDNILSVIADDSELYDDGELYNDGELYDDELLHVPDCIMHAASTADRRDASAVSAAVAVNGNGKDVGVTVPSGQVNHKNDNVVRQKAMKFSKSFLTHLGVLGLKSRRKIMDAIILESDDSYDYKAEWPVSVAMSYMLKKEWTSLETFMGEYDKIIVRRWRANEANSECIPYHLDFHKKVMQVVLNADHQGGLLFYDTDNGVVTPTRVAGMVYIHNDKIAHGVTPLTGGQRFSLYLIKE